MEELKLTQEWDKTSPKSDKVNHSKVTFVNRFGICGWDGLAINAAAIDTRIKATVASTMYDMTRVTAKGTFALFR